MTEVTVIVPCYNQGHYLGLALDSILAQDMHDWEVVLVDDGSTDNTADVAQGYSDHRIRYIRQENRGLSAARNTGLECAAGRYLTFLDADDEWEPEFLSSCLTTLNEVQEVAGVYTWNSFIDADGRRLPQQGKQTVRPQQFRRRLLEGGFFPVHAAVLRRRALSSIGGFDEWLVAGTGLEDWDLWLCLSQQFTMVNIPQLLVRYRVYPGTMSTDAEEMQANRLAVLKKHFDQDEGDPTSWSEEKRLAYGFAYRSTALDYLQQGKSDRCWRLLSRAIGLCPDIVERSDTYYELALGQRPRGYRSQLSNSELQVNARATLDWLDRLFERGSQALKSRRSKAYGQAFLALAILADVSDEWQQARAYLRRAVMADPRLLGESNVMRRMLKLHAGQGLVSRFRQAG